VDEDDEILVVTEGGMLIRMNAAEIRRIGRATQGVRIIRLKEGDRVVSVARAEASEDEDIDFTDEEGAEPTADPGGEDA
jgi:DNA gyrase subunit A